MSFPSNMAKQEVVESETTPQINFLIRKCDNCGAEVKLGAGDVLFGDRWYHARCWEILRGLGPSRLDTS